MIYVMAFYDYTSVQYMVFDCEVLWSIFKLSGYKSFVDKILFHSNSILNPNKLVGHNFPRLDVILNGEPIGLGNHVSQQRGIKYWGK
jgi:hypothetical protein